MEAGGGTFEAAFESLEGAAEGGAFSLFPSVPRLFPVQLRSLPLKRCFSRAEHSKGRCFLSRDISFSQAKRP